MKARVMVLLGLGLLVILFGVLTFVNYGLYLGGVTTKLWGCLSGGVLMTATSFLFWKVLRKTKA